MNVADELAKLQQLHQNGGISDEEFAAAKARLLAGTPGGPAMADPAALERDTRQWAMMLHLSMLAGFLVPMGGLIAPIIIWQIKKNELPGIDEHGKNAVNWIISFVIYMAVSAVLVVAIVGFLLVPTVAVLGVIFPVIAGIKASNGELWKYPLAIPFLK